jgi:DNA polymerase-3 subunit alpha
MKDERVLMAGAIAAIRRIMTKKGEAMVVAQLEDLHGAIEAVVFPRTYAANPGIWAEDNIVVVGGKITLRSDGRGDDEGRGRPEILVDTAEEWVPDPNQPDPVEDESVVERPELIADTVDLSEIEDVGSDEVLGHGLAVDLVAEAAPASPRSAAETVRLTIEFRESGDRRQDLDRLQRLHALLAKSPGDDPYAIVFVAGERRSRLVGDQLRLAYSQDLASTLEELLGVGCVRISAEAVAALS